LCSSLFALAPPEQQVYRFEVEVRTVYVDVFVTRNGKSVTGLTASDFEVLDNGVRQEVRLMDVDTMPMSVMLLLDTSGSVLGRKLAHLREAAHAIIGRLGEEDEVGLMSFSYEQQFLEPTRDIGRVHEALNRSKLGGPTALYDALYSGLKLAEARPGRPLVLVYTDGTDNASLITASEVLDVVKESEAVVHAVSIRSRAGVTFQNTQAARLTYWRQFPAKVGPRGNSKFNDPDRFLEALTETTGGRVWYADSSEGLKSAYLRVFEEMATRYILSFEPKGVPKEGWHPLEVKLNDTKAVEVRARLGYRYPARK
jgi:VWFA-related protein